ncbi:unnamed protein product [Medioppia subpectinata]|uniref:Transmembrane protein 186 n=1 Tax=Medioppia subpectinata TaxID=1979941 RepID=A0A7R9LZ54_9ACAR|nr:unnamed protein product [Medioppia subpectinata]CAG2122384.1 unnamed protein product [Medioppia subpectinata]
MLYVFGFFFRQLVGRVYISRDESMVRLSHLSFFGNRVDTEVEASDVVPLAVSNDRLNDFFCRIERFSCDDLLYMSLKYGGVVNREAFEQVFGKNSAIGSRK